MSLFRLIWTILTAAGDHRAGPVPALAKSVKHPHVELIGQGKVRLIDDWLEPIWPTLGIHVRIPFEFVSDGYSIPRIAWIVVGHPYSQDCMIPALVHDYLCDTATDYEQRVLADAVFFLLLKRYGVSRWKRIAFYLAVRCCGRYMWGAGR